MTTNTWQQRRKGRVMAAVAAALLGAPVMASAADGTIWFIGAITTSPLQISAAPAVSTTRVGTANAQAARRGSDVSLTFNSSPGVVSGGDVALQVAGAAQSSDAVATRFVDGGGRVVAAHDGHYPVGRDGGVLSLSPKPGGSGTPVIVVVSYD